MKDLLFTLIMILTGYLSSAQQERDHSKRQLNVYSYNVLGDAPMSSLSYERLFNIDSTNFVSSKLGIGSAGEFDLCIYSNCPGGKTYLSLPHHLTFNFGKTAHYFEIGMGGSIITGHNSSAYFFYPIVGYRIHPIKRKKLTFRVFALYPFSTGKAADDVTFLPIGMSTGLSF